MQSQQSKYEPCLTSNLAAPPRKNCGSFTISDALTHSISYFFHLDRYSDFSVYKDLSDGRKVESSKTFLLLRHLQGNVIDLSRTF